MVMRRDNTRYILGYFLESKLWKKWVADVVDNYAYWINEDPKRAAKMFAARTANMKGYTIEDYIFDMLSCVSESNLKEATKQRLFDEIDWLENFHKTEGTLKAEL